EHLELLLEAGATRVDVLAEGVVLRLVPADPDTELEAATAHLAQIGRHPRDQRSRVERQDQDGGTQMNNPRMGGEIGEEDEELAIRIRVRIGREIGIAIRRRGGDVTGTRDVVHPSALEG